MKDRSCPRLPVVYSAYAPGAITRELLHPHFFTCLSQFLSPFTGLAASALGLAEPWGTVSCPGWSWSDGNPVFFIAIELLPGVLCAPYPRGSLALYRQRLKRQ